MKPVTEREHETGDPDCWCHPIAYTLCPECEGDGCWRCEGHAPWPGLVPASEYEAGDDTTPCLIVHGGADELPPADYIRHIVEAMQQDLDDCDD